VPAVIPDRRRADDGFALVWLALLLVVLLGAAALGIDISQWHFWRNRLQRAADAAALAAAAHWPQRPDLAVSEALAGARRNGFTDGANGGRVRVTVSPGMRPTQVKVTVSTSVHNFFGQIFGAPEQRLSRSAVAEYQGPVPMGSPANTYGNEPLARGERRWSTLTQDPQLWANVFGPRSLKSKGDAHQAKVCTATTADNCPQAGVSPPPGYNTSNTDYRPEGYLYTVRVVARPATASRLAIEVFDPAFVNVGDRCTLNLTGAEAFNSETPNRYASGPASPFCTGDQIFTSPGEDGRPPVTTYIVREPDDTPWSQLDNPPIRGGAGTCDSDRRQFQGYNSLITALLTTNPAEPNYRPTLRFADHFRRWVRICELPAGAQTPLGDYVLQVKTSAPPGDPYGTGYDTGGGANRFSIRAAWILPGETPDATGISVFASEAMGAYANATGADTRFHLARVFPGADGRVLKLRFFDTGDASTAGDLTVLAPPDSNVAAFSGCLVTRASTGQVNDPVPGCTVTGLHVSRDNGRWIVVQVPIPDGYTCDQASATGCWVRVRFTYPPGTSVSDTTTWTAEIVGDPVRLVD
jgi:hypothetical protein